MAINDPYSPVYMNPNASRAGLWDMRLMSAANRSETPFEHGIGHSYGHPMAQGGMLGNMGAMASEPDYSAFTFNPEAHAAAQKYLGQYGLSPLEASQVKQNTLLPNTGFFGSHPKLSRALEGGLFGVAASHGGMTPGESMQGAVEGLIGGHRIQQGLYNQQFARPFEAAGMIEGLQDAAQRRELQSADIEHLRAVNEHLKNGDDFKLQQLTETNRHNEAVEANRNAAEGNTWLKRQAERPEPDAYGTWVYNPSKEGTGQSPWDYHLGEGGKESRYARSQAGMMKGVVETKDAKGVLHRRYVEIAPGQEFPAGFKPMQETYENRTGDVDTRNQDNKRQAYLSKSRKPSELFNMGYRGKMNDGVAKQKFLENFYDNQVAPYAGQQQQVPEGTGGFHRNPDGSWSE